MISDSQNFLTEDCVEVCAGMEPIPLSLLVSIPKRKRVR